MKKQSNKEIFHRIWYLPDLWWKVKSPANPKSLKTWRDLLNKRNASKWRVSGEWCEFPYIFLVDKPLTFGHSQLVMPIPSNQRSTNSTNKEFIHFECASIMIKRAIKGFVEAFNKNKLHTEKKYCILAERTLSFGRYEKTIIMRVSAKEGQNKYKVHLVPYFESNAEMCQERYYSIHKVPEKKGGLIGWLGDKETEVDSWQIGHNELEETVRDKWKLHDLANNLRKLCP